MFRRYLAIFLVLVLLVASYFVFFRDNEENLYNNYFVSLTDNEDFENDISFLDFYVERENNESNFDYIFTFDNADYKLEDIKIMIIDENYEEKEVVYPSFGIVSYFDYDIIPPTQEIEEENEKKGINLVLIDYEQIENVLILIEVDKEEFYYQIDIRSFL